MKKTNKQLKGSAQETLKSLWQKIKDFFGSANQEPPKPQPEKRKDVF